MTQKLAILLSEYLTICDANKKVVVRYQLIGLNNRVRKIAGHGGEMKWRRSDQTLRLSTRQ